MAGDWFFTWIHTEFCVFFHLYQTTYCPVIFHHWNCGCNCIHSLRGCVLSLTQRLEIWYFPFPVCVSFPSDCSGICVLWVHSCIGLLFAHDLLGCIFPFYGGIGWGLLWVPVRSVQLCFSPVKAWIVVWLLACSGFVLGLHWSGEWGPEVLDKPGGLRTTQTGLLSWLSSPQSLNSTRREIMVWGTALQRKGWFPCVGGVWVF